jgi:hypothetical protein
MQIKPNEAAPQARLPSIHPQAAGSIAPEAGELKQAPGSLLATRAATVNVSLSGAVRALATALGQLLPDLGPREAAALLTPADRLVLVRARDYASSQHIALDEVKKLVVDLLVYRALEQGSETRFVPQLQAAAAAFASPTLLEEAPTQAAGLAQDNATAPVREGASDALPALRAPAANDASAQLRPKPAASGMERDTLALPAFTPRDEALARTILSGTALRDTPLDRRFVQALLDPDQQPSHAVDFEFLRRLVIALSPAPEQNALDPLVSFARRDARTQLAQAVSTLAVALHELPALDPESFDQGARVLLQRLPKLLAEADLEQPAQSVPTLPLAQALSVSRATSQAALQSLPTPPFPGGARAAPLHAPLVQPPSEPLQAAIGAPAHAAAPSNPLAPSATAPSRTASGPTAPSATASSLTASSAAPALASVDRSARPLPRLADGDQAEAGPILAAITLELAALAAPALAEPVPSRAGVRATLEAPPGAAAQAPTTPTTSAGPPLATATQALPPRSLDAGSRTLSPTLTPAQPAPARVVDAAALGAHIANVAGAPPPASTPDARLASAHGTALLTRNDRALLGLLYATTQKRGVEPAAVDQVARALIELRRAERAEARPAAVAGADVRRVAAEIAQSAAALPRGAAAAHARSAGTRAGASETHVHRAEPHEAQRQQPAMASAEQHLPARPLTAEFAPGWARAAFEPPLPVSASQASATPEAQPAAREKSGVEPFVMANAHADASSASAARSFGSSTQLAARVAGTYGSFAPPSMAQAGAAVGYNAAPAFDPLLARDATSAATPQALQLPLPARPLDVAQALGVKGLVSELRERSRAVRLSQRQGRDASVRGIEGLREAAYDAEVDDPLHERNARRRRRARWQLLLQRRKRRRKQER